MVELRKRKATETTEELPATKGRRGKNVTKPEKVVTADDKSNGPKTASSGAGEDVDITVDEKKEQANPTAKSKDAATSSKAPGKEAGDVIESLDSFGGEITTHDGRKVTLKQLVDESKGGIAIFTYPKASTGGCTKQACAFRDGHEHLTSTGLTIFGLSADSPKSNANFVTKQNLPFTLLCDPAYSLIKAIGKYKAQAPGSKTKRGVWAVNKEGKVLLSFDGGPDPTVNELASLVSSQKS